MDEHTPALADPEIELTTTTTTMDEEARTDDALLARTDAEAVEAPTPLSTLAWFWLLGVLNNASYVIMIASAKSIDDGGVALIYVCAVAPGVCTKASAPLWFDRVGYRTRLLGAATSMFCGFLLAGPLSGGALGLQLLGVLLCSLQTSLGEASLLALSSRHAGRGARAVAAWSSGTGAAGILGYAWVWALTPGSQGGILDAATYEVLKRGLGASVPLSLAAILLPAAYACAAARLLREKGPAQDVAPAPVDLTLGERLGFAASLWPTTGAIFLVYFSEYAMQSGVWAAMGFPEPVGRDDDGSSRRDKFYIYSNWLYQCGVLVSRSSGFFFRRPPSLKALWSASLLQAFLLVFFSWDAAEHFWYDASVLCVCFVVGLLGGAVYVHGFRRLAARQELPELAMPVGAFASDAGTLCSNVAGLFLQACLYEANGIPGATVHFSLGCR